MKRRSWGARSTLAGFTLVVFESRRAVKNFRGRTHGGPGSGLTRSHQPEISWIGRHPEIGWWNFPPLVFHLSPLSGAVAGLFSTFLCVFLVRQVNQTLKQITTSYKHCWCISHHREDNFEDPEKNTAARRLFPRLRTTRCLKTWISAGAGVPWGRFPVRVGNTLAFAFRVRRAPRTLWAPPTERAWTFCTRYIIYF